MAVILTNDRYKKIFQLLKENKSVTLAQLIDELQISESTVRRDLLNLEKSGRLIRVHGGAVLKGEEISENEDQVSLRRTKNYAEKRKIAAAAAPLIEPGDLVYIDAGTTTEALLEKIDQADARYVTNAILHAKTLAEKGLNVTLAGGTFKALTEAIVGAEAVDFLDKYNFTKGFFGTNGIDRNGNLTTVDIQEAMVKKKAMQQCRIRYILADATKINVVTPIKFGSLENSILITNPVEETSIVPEHTIFSH